ncbi:MAG: Crp/Fnr family transcriptional regulator [Candidatus Saccharimonadaceae bacterium]
MNRTMDGMEYIRQSPIKQFQSGTILLQKGDPLDFIMALREGYIKITSISDGGIERLLWIAGRYDFAPVEQLFSKQSQARFFYTALTNGSYYEVDRAELLKNASQHPSIMAEVARGMSEHYDDFLQRIDSIDGLSVRERLLKTLHYLAQRFSASSDVNLYDQGLRITHQDLASMIGSTRETTSFTLSELRDEGYISYDRKSFVIHVDKIIEIID